MAVPGLPARKTEVNSFMKTLMTVRLALVVCAILVLAGGAMAGGGVSFSVNVGGGYGGYGSCYVPPVVCRPAPVYYTPAYSYHRPVIVRYSSGPAYPYVRPYYSGYYRPAGIYRGPVTVRRVAPPVFVGGVVSGCR